MRIFTHGRWGLWRCVLFVLVPLTPLSVSNGQRPDLGFGGASEHSEAGIANPRNEVSLDELLKLDIDQLRFLPISHLALVMGQPPGDSSFPAMQSDGQDSDATGSIDNLLDLDIAQLRKTTVAPAFEEVVTTVSRQASTVGRTPAAVFVLTSEMIRRSGARSVPEALRLVPGLIVARIDSNKWAISCRGFNGRFANMLLVQIDGRTVYTPFYSGVFWDAQDILLDNIERIEVIRGPGASVWGANAVNGVINIITKDARETVGVYATGGGGTEEVGFSGARVGGCALDGDLHWRLSGKWAEQDPGFRSDQPTYDGWRQGRGGFRLDWTPTDCDQFTFQGDMREEVYSDASALLGPVTPNIGLGSSGGYLQGRWGREIDETSGWALQFYYDRFGYDNSNLALRVDTYDIDFQQNFQLAINHKLVWGLGYRWTFDTNESSPPYTLSPTHNTWRTGSAFVQDEITLLEDRWYLTVGTKLSDNTVTDFEVQPTIRMLWMTSESSAAWAAVSRAVRTPSRGEVGITLGLGGPSFLLGNPNLLAENMIAYEIGYRSQPVEWFSWDLATFYQVYEDLTATTAVPPNLEIQNNARGQAYGLELTGQVDMTECWKISGWYALLRTHHVPGPGALLSYGTLNTRSSPRHQVFLQSSWDLGCDTELDILGRYVDNLEAIQVPKYIELDLRLARHVTPNLELAAVGQNLLNSHHQEFVNDAAGTQYTEAQRGVYGQLTWRY